MTQVRGGLSITQLAAQTGFGPDTIRYYERTGLLPGTWLPALGLVLGPASASGSGSGSGSGPRREVIRDELRVLR